MLWSVLLFKGIEFVGKILGSDVIFFVEFLGLRNSFYLIMVMSCWIFCNIEEKFFMKDVVCKLDFDWIELLLLRFEVFCDWNFGFWEDGWFGGVVIFNFGEDLYGKENLYMSNIISIDVCGDVMLFFLFCKFLEVNNGDFMVEELSLSWDL